MRWRGTGQRRIGQAVGFSERVHFTLGFGEHIGFSLGHVLDVPVRVSLEGAGRQ
ncbi:hypothetical protein ACFU8Q_04135 [Streptomyces sp. NPDC057543]|uniref:hypothetical protein n=1 Tax=Streptomyces sp. NPDC057543 TaxID=3346163 RepID=UPI00367FDA39